MDDDAAVLDALTFVLESEGFRVAACSNAASALNAPTDAVACLIIDHHLPDLAGLELLTQLRARGACCAAILITTNPPSPLRRRAEQMGIPVVEKPFLSDTLLTTIRQQIAAANPET